MGYCAAPLLQSLKHQHPSPSAREQFYQVSRIGDLAPRPSSTVCCPLAVHGYNSVLMPVPKHGWRCSLFWVDRCTAWVTKTGPQRPASVLPGRTLRAACANPEYLAEYASRRSLAAGTVRTHPTAHCSLTGAGWVSFGKTCARGGAFPGFVQTQVHPSPPL